MRIERNMMSPVTEKERLISEEIAKIPNAGLPSSIGLPSSVVPPGTALAVVKEIPATREATTEQDWDMCISHSLLSFIRSACDFLKISRDVLPLLLLLK
ncbi:hypothetical protein A2U01_0001845 [Trifolium medium]|uniref:Uncharacterized protein n=1 Tax=Trifolium medium TaxID=97028 RepID=A0A392M1C2_9FABA|nr:hypothetical protein [Trifolium medium]